MNQPETQFDTQQEPAEIAVEETAELENETGGHLAYGFSRRFGLLIDEQQGEPVIIARPD